MRFIISSMWSVALAALIPTTLHSGEVVPTYTAHEWGTFTSVQGSDGQAIAWNPFTTWELPGFVYARHQPLRGPDFAAFAGDFALMDLKQGGNWLQRMETPVIYFYAATNFSVDVRVRFPTGLVTEWYPSVTAFGPYRGSHGLMPASDQSYAEWKGLRVLASPAEPQPVRDSEEHHYYAARATAANLVQATHRLNLPMTSNPEIEKFLFYRGAGNFQAPLKVTFSGEHSLRLENRSPWPLPFAMAFHVSGAGLRQVATGPLAPGATRELTWPELAADPAKPASTDAATRALELALVDAGLRSDEAAAMVGTWRQAWLMEEGWRVLYVLSAPWVDEVLPVTFDPPPASFTRVFVGRAELIPPSAERTLHRLLVEARNHPEAKLAGEVKALHLGRFLPAGLARAVALEKECLHMRFRQQWQEPELSERLQPEWLALQEASQRLLAIGQPSPAAPRRVATVERARP